MDCPDTDLTPERAPVLRIDQEQQQHLIDMINDYSTSRDAKEHGDLRDVWDVQKRLRDCNRDAVSIPIQYFSPLHRVLEYCDYGDFPAEEVGKYRICDVDTGGGELYSLSPVYSGPGDLDVSLLTDGYDISVTVDYLPRTSSREPESVARVRCAPDAPEDREINQYMHLKSGYTRSRGPEIGRSILLLIKYSDEWRAVLPVRESTNDSRNHAPALNVDSVTVKKVTRGKRDFRVERRYRVERDLIEQHVMMVAEWDYRIGRDGVTVTDSRIILPIAD